MGQRFRIEYSAEARDHLRGLDATGRTTVVDSVERKLRYEPTMATRNKKLLQANELAPLAPWELRVDRWRVYYEVRHHEAGPLVLGEGRRRKARGKVMIAGEVTYRSASTSGGPGP